MLKISKKFFFFFIGFILLTALWANFNYLYKNNHPALASVKPEEINKTKQKILVVAPHCDDEVLAVGGVIYQALQRGDQVKVVIMTNGDGFSKAADLSFPSISSKTQRYISLAETRQQESIKGLKILGISEEDIIFLGYPDKGLASMWSKNLDHDKPYFNSNTESNHSPYLRDYSPQALYTGRNVIEDLTKIIGEYNPNHIYYPHPNDLHPDHWATNSFVKYVLTKENTNNIEEHLYLIHRGMWPTAWLFLTEKQLRPPQSLTDIGTYWVEIPLTQKGIYLKKEAILAHQTQVKVMKQFLLSFARANELLGYYPDLSLPLDKKELLIGDPQADTWKNKTNGEGDIIGVYGVVDHQNLKIELRTRLPISKEINYYLHLRFLENGKPTKLADLKIKGDKITFLQPSVNSLTEIKGLKLIVEANSLSLDFPLNSLPLLEALYLNAESKKGNSLVDRTAWRMLLLEKKAFE